MTAGPVQYTIEARALSIGGVAGHDFWVLRDGQGTAVAELHGLATDRATGEAVPIGTDEDRHSLRIWHFAHDREIAARSGEPVSRTSYVQDGQVSRTVLTGPKDDVLARWDAAVAARSPLNTLDRDYPNYGFRLDGSTVNSNSAYRTLGEIMGVAVRDFPRLLEPGIENRMVPPERIEQLRVRDQPVLTAPARIDGERVVPLENEGLPAPRRAKAATLLEQTYEATARLDAQLGRSRDETTDRVAHHLAARAQEQGLTRVDHVVLSVQTARLQAGEHVFAVQGSLDAPDRHHVHLRTADAVLPPTQETMALAALAARTPAAPLAREEPSPQHDAPRMVRA